MRLLKSKPLLVFLFRREGEDVVSRQIGIAQVDGVSIEPHGVALVVTDVRGLLVRHAARSGLRQYRLAVGQVPRSFCLQRLLSVGQLRSVMRRVGLPFSERLLVVTHRPLGTAKDLVLSPACVLD